jgi:hypothetical protein
VRFEEPGQENHMRTGRTGAAMVAALTGMAVLVAHPASATTRSFSCTQTTSGRLANRQAVTGRLSADGSPADVVVSRVKTGAADFGPVADPPLANAGDFDYWHRTYGLDGYDVSKTPFPPPGSRRGLFGIPRNPPGITGPTFTGFVLTQFTGGGNWQHWFSCTVS